MTNMLIMPNASGAPLQRPLLWHVRTALLGGLPFLAQVYVAVLP